MAKKIGAVWKHGEYDTERITPGLLGSKGIKWVGHSTDNPGLDTFRPGLFSFLFCCFVFSLVSLPRSKQRSNQRTIRDQGAGVTSPPIPGQWLSTPPLIDYLTTI